MLDSAFFVTTILGLIFIQFGIPYFIVKKDFKLYKYIIFTAIIFYLGAGILMILFNLFPDFDITCKLLGRTLFLKLTLIMYAYLMYIPFFALLIIGGAILTYNKLKK